MKKSRSTEAQAEEHSIMLDFTRSGTPTQHSYAERFKRTNRDEILNIEVFKTLDDVRELTQTWVIEYNEERRHDSLGDLTL